MSFLENISIRTKVLSAFIVVLLLADGLGLFALRSLSAVNDASSSLRDTGVPSLRQLGAISTYS
ncbi:MAG TPA: methyl-accepting chemotaxis protein, partial [Methylocystis sp.]|nr:methyl-accepting chemotaxis protein [Methylocystis sp.]